MKKFPDIKSKQLEDYKKRESGSSDLFKTIFLKDIVLNPNQPRKTFDEERIRELALSIKENGLIQPIIVEEMYDNDKKLYYEITAGERRFRAVSLLGLSTISAVVRSNTEKRDIHSIIENTQRESLTFFEEANAIFEVMNSRGLNQKELSIILGKSERHIRRLLCALKIDKELVSALVENHTSITVIEKLSSFEDFEAQRNAFEKIKGLNRDEAVAKLEYILSKKDALIREEKTKANSKRVEYSWGERRVTSKNTTIFELKQKLDDATITKIEELISSALNP